jgi:hypothetical protein
MEEALPYPSPEAEAQVDGWLRALGDRVLQEAIPRRLLDALGVRDQVAPKRSKEARNKPVVDSPTEWSDPSGSAAPGMSNGGRSPGRS